MQACKRVKFCKLEEKTYSDETNESCQLAYIELPIVKANGRRPSPAIAGFENGIT